jgi:hypothetical protein
MATSNWLENPSGPGAGVAAAGVAAGALFIEGNLDGAPVSDQSLEMT